MTVHTCQGCGRIYNSDVLQRCPLCGADLKEPAKKCPKCGTKMVVAGPLGWSAIVLFCPECEPDRKEPEKK